MSDSYWRQQNTDFFLRISKGEVQGVSSEFKFGRSALIGSTESVVWDGGGDYTWLTSAEKMSIVSTDITDNITGVGARTLLVAGLDANFNPLSETIILTGTTPVITTGEFLRVFRALVATSGTDSAVTDANKGDITITGNTSSTIVAKVLIGNGQTLMTPYTVPAGKAAYITGANFSAGEGKQCTFRGKIRNALQSVNGSFSVKYILDIFEFAFDPAFTVPLQVPEKTDVCFTAVTASGTIDASASYGIILIDNEV